ncbi:MAG: TonB-dependent receptor [Colwellia sp.]|uniref:TonB-dependent receptor n=1 Tax=Colwellia sp. TaxID=56799 RepID=UPI0025BAA510|nr:TonB-dependent receptor [Colwellia sp.]NQZ27970.1 TonB-dependent receptor [Colwellia sp.]
MLKEFKKSKIASFVCMALTASVASNAFAEETEKKNKLKEIEVIEVTGVRSSLNSALNAKKNSETISDSIIAEEIGKSSDENIAQALSRIAGVSLDRNGGDSQTITVRGVQASLNDIKLNGVSMTSNTDSQAVDLSLFSADILSRIDVVKSPAANQEEGSLGASINLYTRAPLSSNKNVNVFSVEARYNELAEETTPRFSYTGLYQFSDSIGIAGSLFHDKQSVRKEQFSTNGWRLNSDSTNNKAFTGATNALTGETLPDNTAAMMPDAALARVNLDDKLKQGGTFTFQMRPGDATDIRFDASFSRQEIDHLHSQTRLNNLDRASGKVLADVSIIPGDASTASTVTSAFSKKPGTQAQNGQWANTTDSLITGLEIEHAIGDYWLVKGRVGYSDTSQEWSDSYKVNWWSKAATSSSNEPNDWCGVDYAHGPQGDYLPEFSYCTNWNNEDASYWQMGQARVQMREVDDSKAGYYFDVSRSFDSDLITSVEFGVKYTDRTKAVIADEAVKKWTQFEDGKTKIFADQVDGVLDSSITGGHFLDGIAPVGMPTTWLSPDVNASIALAFPNGTEGQFESSPLKSWQVHEKTYGAYVQANFELLTGDITGNFGVRYAHTEIEGNSHSGYEYPDDIMFVVDGLSVPASDYDAPVSVTDTKDYGEFLPSFTVNYLLTENIVLRTSAARVMARPSIDDLNPNFRLKSSNLNETPEAKGGNTQLEPFLADQFDFSAEWYFEEGALLSAAFFYKDFKSFSYDSSVFKEFTNPIDGNCIVDRSALPPEEQLTAMDPCAKVQYRTSVNGASADIQGMELAYQQHYDFLPGLLKHLGTSINYTYADSEAIVDPEDETNPYNGLPFVNTSKHSANATVYWENEDMSFRFAYAYRTKALVDVTSGNSSKIRDDRGTLDFTANFDITKALKLSFSATNLTKSYDRIFNVLTAPEDSGLTKEFTGDLSSVNDSRVDEIYNYGRSYRLSMRYTF